MRNFALALILIVTSCTMSQEQEINLDGKIAIENSNGVSASLYFPATKRTVTLRYDKEIVYGGLHWANTTEDFVGIEQFSNKMGRTTRGNVIRFDLNGKIIDTVYEAKENELTGNAYLSIKDNKLLFTLSIDHFDPLNPLAQLTRPTSIVVMDFRKKEIVKKIESVGPSSKIEFNESPWFKDEDRFVYDIRGDRKITVEGGDGIEDNNAAGVYMYDLNAGSHTLLVKGGQYGVVSPVANHVAYIKEGHIWIYDLAKNTKRVIFTPGEKEKVMHIHWTPSGEYIYLTNYNEFALGVFAMDEKLIRIDDGAEIAFNKESSPGSSSTWK